MKSSLLKSLRGAISTKTPACVVTYLETGEQNLLTHEEPLEGELVLPEDLRQEALQALARGRSGLLSDENYFVECLLPPARLMVVGAVHIAQKLCPMADLMGYEVTLIDPRRAWSTSARFPGLTILQSWPDEALEQLAPDSRSAIVTLTHDPKLDDPALEAALKSPAFYIGALGSTRTHAQRLQRLRDLEFEDETLKRIHGPVGLSIGARAPSEIAVSILAELTATLHGAAPQGKAPKDA